MASKKTGLPPSNFSFGLKLSFEKKKNVTADYISLKHTEDGHNKFYIIKLRSFTSTPFVVSINYGKIGTNGNTTNHSFDELQEARKFINKKMGEKIRKGYKTEF